MQTVVIISSTGRVFQKFRCCYKGKNTLWEIQDCCVELFHLISGLIKNTLYVFRAYCWARIMRSLLLLVKQNSVRKKDLVIILMYVDSLWWVNAFSSVSVVFRIIFPPFGCWNWWSDRLRGFFMVTCLTCWTKIWRWKSWIHFLSSSGL